MKSSPGVRGLVIPLVFVAVVIASSAITSLPEPKPGPRYAALNLNSDTQKADKLVQTLGITEMMGPLAPVALSPFFSLTVLSGASLASDTGLLPDAIAKNAMLGSGSPLNNGLVFTGLLALTVVTALPKLTKVTKPVGQVIDQIEGHAGIIGVVAVQTLSQLNLGDTGGDHVSMVYQAGFISFSTTALVSIASAVNIFVVNLVKYFFEVLIFLSPFPVVDAFFEALNKAFAAFLLAVYLWSPAVATGMNFIIFAICFLIFLWAHRRVVYMRSILGDPMLGWLAEKIFRRPPVGLTTTPLPGSIGRQLPDARVVLKAFAGRGVAGVSRKARGYLVLSGGRLHFAAPRLLRSPRIVALPQQGHTVAVENGLLSNTVRLKNDAGDTAAKIVFSRRYNAILDPIRAQVGAMSAAGKAASVDAGILDVGRSLKDVVKGDGRESLRAEFA